jgi:hypothetical protein
LPNHEATAVLSLMRTWTQRPMLTTTYTNPYKGIFPTGAGAVAVGPDDTIYASMLSDMWPTGIPAGLYRLAPNANRWKLPSPPPRAAAVATTEIPGSGILWEAPYSLGPEYAELFPNPGA